MFVGVVAHCYEQRTTCVGEVLIIECHNSRKCSQNFLTNMNGTNLQQQPTPHVLEQK